MSREHQRERTSAPADYQLIFSSVQLIGDCWRGKQNRQYIFGASAHTGAYRDKAFL